MENAIAYGVTPVHLVNQIQLVINVQIIVQQLGRVFVKQMVNANVNHHT